MNTAMVLSRDIPHKEIQLVVDQHKKAGLLPDRMTPAQVHMCLARAAALGVSPYEAIFNTVVIDGKVTLMSSLLQAVVRRALPEMQVEVVEYTRESCTIRGRRTHSDPWIEITYDIEDAKLAGLLGKRNWKQHPKAMLYARAASTLNRMLAPDVIHGVYTADELGVEEDPDGERIELSVEQPQQEQVTGPDRQGEVVDAPFEQSPPTQQEQEHLNEADKLAARIGKTADTSPTSDEPSSSKSQPDTDEPKESKTKRLRRIANQFKADGVTTTQIAGVKVLEPLVKEHPDIDDESLIEAALAILTQDKAGEEDQTPPAEKPKRRSSRRKTDGDNPRATFWAELSKLTGEKLEHKLTEVEDLAEEAMGETGDMDIMARAQANCPVFKDEDGAEHTWDEEDAPDQVLKYYALALFDSISKARGS